MNNLKSKITNIKQNSIKNIILVLFSFFLLLYFLTFILVFYFSTVFIRSSFEKDYVFEYLTNPIQYSHFNLTEIFHIRTKILNNIITESNMYNLNITHQYLLNNTHLNNYICMNNINNSINVSLIYSHNNSILNTDENNNCTNFPYKYLLISHITNMRNLNFFPNEIYINSNEKFLYYYDSNSSINKNYLHKIIKKKKNNFKSKFITSFISESYRDVYLYLMNMNSTINNNKFDITISYSQQSLLTILDIDNYKKIGAIILFFIEEYILNSSIDIIKPDYGSFYSLIYNTKIFEIFIKYIIKINDNIKSPLNIDIKPGYNSVESIINYVYSKLKFQYESIYNNEFNQNFENEVSVFATIFYYFFTNESLLSKHKFEIETYLNNCKLVFDKNEYTPLCNIYIKEFLNKKYNNSDNHILQMSNYTNDGINFTKEKYFKRPISMPFQTNKEMFSKNTNISNLTMDVLPILLYEYNLNDDLSFGVFNIKDTTEYNNIQKDFENNNNKMIIILSIIISLVVVSFIISFIILNKILNKIILNIEIFRNINIDLFINIYAINKIRLLNISDKRMNELIDLCNKYDAKNIENYSIDNKLDILSTANQNNKINRDLQSNANDDYNKLLNILQDGQFEEKYIIILYKTQKSLMEYLTIKNHSANHNNEVYSRKYSLLSKFDMSLNDYDLTNSIYSILDINYFFSLEQYQLNIYYSDMFINKNMNVIYRLLTIVEENKKNDKKVGMLLDISDVIKICDDIKENLLNPYIIGLFNNDIRKKNQMLLKCNQDKFYDEIYNMNRNLKL